MVTDYPCTCEEWSRRTGITTNAQHSDPKCPYYKKPEKVAKQP